MGMMGSFTGKNTAQSADFIERYRDGGRVIALAGNPNVGKSTVFNALTGMRQHTGNWPGKTVAAAAGEFTREGVRCVLVDVPGAYSLMAHSREEEVARDFLCFGGADAAVVVCDAACLERNLNLVLQTIEIASRTIVVVNLLDEAEKKHIRIDLDALEKKLGVPVVGAAARSGRGLDELADRILETTESERITPLCIRYPEEIETAVEMLEPCVSAYRPQQPNARWIALKLLEGDETLTENICRHLGADILRDEALTAALGRARSYLADAGLDADKFRSALVSTLYRIAEDICRTAVVFENAEWNDRQLRIDRILTGRYTGVPIMLLLLLLIFYLTMVGANYPSQLLARGLFWIQDRLSGLFVALGLPDWLHGAVVLGVYRTLAWVISVMLPPMAIFFPLFTLLEDLGYLPRVAFNLDRQFKRCCACGKQALSMWIRQNGTRLKRIF